MDIRFDLRWYFGNDGADEISTDLFPLLNAIQAGGSLRAAAQECGLSYRHAWGLLQKWEQLTGHTLVRLERGKGAMLTRLGQKLTCEHQRILSEFEPKLSRLSFELAAGLSEAISRESRNTLQICASHGLAVAMLRDLAHKRSKLNLDLKFLGSLDSLQFYKNGRCDLAGFHLPEGIAGTRFLPRLRRYLNPATDALIYGVRRRQGLITAKDNPHEIHELSDLIRTPIRFLNRQNNSGTRITFDYLLEDAGIDPERIHGYHTEEFTHLAVAALVASGAADATFGIEEAAHRFNLHFIPFNWETYWFAVARDKLNTEGLLDFLALLRGFDFHEKVAELSGYEATRAGTLVTLDRDLKALLL